MLLMSASPCISSVSRTYARGGLLFPPPSLRPSLSALALPCWCGALSRLCAVQEEKWSLEQRLEEMARHRSELEHECARLIKEIRALHLQLDETDGNMERMRSIVRQTEQQLSETARESEEGTMGMAKLRMSNAELQGRLTDAQQRLQEAADALDEEKAEHEETRRKLRDAVALLEKARAEQRDVVKVHTRALEDQHSREAEETKRQAEADVRKAEDRIRELQREVVAKEDQRVAMLRHAEGLEQKLLHAQEEARAYLKTVEGASEKHKEQALSKDDALRKVQAEVQQLERVMRESEVEHKRQLEQTSEELRRNAQQERDKAQTERKDAERKLCAEHRDEMDKLQQALRAKHEEEADALKKQLREEQDKSDTRIAALEEVNRDIQARSEDVVRDKMRALESECKGKVDKAFAEAAERCAKVEKSWREQMEKSEQQLKQRIVTLEAEIGAADRAAQVCWVNCSCVQADALM